MLGIKRQEPGGHQSPGSFGYAQSVSFGPRGGAHARARLLSAWPLRKSPGLIIDGEGDEHDLFHRVGPGGAIFNAAWAFFHSALASSNVAANPDRDVPYTNQA
jgi:hypothetical protein